MSLVLSKVSTSCNITYTQSRINSIKQLTNTESTSKEPQDSIFLNVISVGISSKNKPQKVYF